MKIDKISILSVSDTDTGNAVFKCLFQPEGLPNFYANLRLPHLETYYWGGVKISYRFMNTGNWVELPFVMESFGDNANVDGILTKG